MKNPEVIYLKCIIYSPLLPDEERSDEFQNVYLSHPFRVSNLIYCIIYLYTFVILYTIVI